MLASGRLFDTGWNPDNPLYTSGSENGSPASPLRPTPVPASMQGGGTAVSRLPQGTAGAQASGSYSVQHNPAFADDHSLLEELRTEMDRLESNTGEVQVPVNPVKLDVCVHYCHSTTLQLPSSGHHTGAPGNSRAAN
jgi:hypothetical protein